MASMTILSGAQRPPSCLVEKHPKCTCLYQQSLIQVYARSFQQILHMVGVLAAVLGPLERANVLESVLEGSFSRTFLSKNTQYILQLISSWPRFVVEGVASSRLTNGNRQRSNQNNRAGQEGEGGKEKSITLQRFKVR